RSWWYGQPTISLARSAVPARAMTTARDRSKTTSYEAPVSQMTMSCCVAGRTYPDGPTTGSLKPVTPGGVADGATDAQSSGRNPATRLTPPIVVRGSRSDATRWTADPGDIPAATSSSRYACDDVPMAKIPVCGVAMPPSSKPCSDPAQPTHIAGRRESVGYSRLVLTRGLTNRACEAHN